MENKKEIYEKYNLKLYTKGEEIGNVITHGIGFLLGLVGMIGLLIRASGTMEILAALLFSIPVMAVYGNSAVYHSLTNPKWKSIWRRIDHSDIGFLVVASGAPVCLLNAGLHNYIGLSVCYAAEIICAILCIINLKKYLYVTFGMHFFSGGILLALFILNKDSMPFETSVFYLIGLIITLLGAGLYLMKIKYVHTIFHVAVLLGTVLMFFGALKLF